MRGYRYGKWEVREKEESFDGEERFYKPSFGIASFFCSNLHLSVQ